MMTEDTIRDMLQMLVDGMASQNHEAMGMLAVALPPELLQYIANSAVAIMLLRILEGEELANKDDATAAETIITKLQMMVALAAQRN